jgi:D-alanyl-D-alanine carboxypeptidase
MYEVARKCKRQEPHMFISSLNRTGRPEATPVHRGFCMIAVIALVGVASLATASVAPARDRTGSLPAVQRALDEVVAARAPGAIALVRDGNRTYRLSSGYGNLAPLTAIRVSDRSRIGGLTKSFVATVVLQLVGEGKLALGDTVERWLPGVISNGEAISITRLLNHTSGIYNYSADPAILAPYIAGDFTRIFDPRVGVQVAADHGPLFAPGSALAYSNTNYLLLAMIVEAATGNSISTELRARIFEPLGLRHTSYPTSSEIEGSYIHGYILFEEGPLDVTSWSPTLFGASGAILSNAKDVARFYRALLSGELLAHKLLKSMKTIDPVATGGVPDSGILGGGWGLGLLREEFPCGEAWGHDGENPGYKTAAWNSKNGKRQVVVIVNHHFFSHDEPVSEAMREVLVTAYCGR